MADNPIHVTAKPYTGKNPRRIRQFQQELETANRLEEHLNDQRIEGQPRILTYYDIAEDLSVSSETVQRLLMRAGGGHNGITI